MRPWLPYRQRDGTRPDRGPGGGRRRGGGGRWNIFVGLLLMGGASWYIANPDYPVPPEPSPISAKQRWVFLPEIQSPIGQSEFQGLVFKWFWRGPEMLWELVLLDAAMEEIVSVGGIRGTSLVPQGDLLARVRAQQCHAVARLEVEALA